MSIASELSALNGHIISAYDEINTMGGTVPQNKNMANLVSAIASIPSGGGGDPNIITGFFTVGSTSETSHIITHNMGTLPRIFICMCAYADQIATTYSNSTPTPARFWICNTDMATGGNSGWAQSSTTKKGLWASTNSQGWTYGTFGEAGTTSALDTGTTGRAAYFNMNTTTATVKSGSSTKYIGTNATFFWVAVKALPSS